MRVVKIKILRIYRVKILRVLRFRSNYLLFGIIRSTSTTGKTQVEVKVVVLSKIRNNSNNGSTQIE